MVADAELVGYALGSLLMAVPAWRIFKKTGQNPLFSLFALIPLLGPMIVALVFGMGKWKRLPDKTWS